MWYFIRKKFSINSYRNTILKCSQIFFGYQKTHFFLERRRWARKQFVCWTKGKGISSGSNFVHFLQGAHIMISMTKTCYNTFNFRYLVLHDLEKKRSNCTSQCTTIFWCSFLHVQYFSCRHFLRIYKTSSNAGDFEIVGHLLTFQLHV